MTDDRNSGVQHLEVEIARQREELNALRAENRTLMAVCNARENQLQLYEAVSATSQDLMAVLDRDYRYLMVNRAFEAYHNLRSDDVKGKTPAILLGENLFNRVLRPRLDRALAGETIYYEVDELASRSGLNRHWSTVAPVSVNGEIIGVVVFMRDITELDVIQTRLRESETRARALLNAMPDMMFRIDSEGRYLDYHANSNELYISDGDFIGKRIADTTPPEFSDLLSQTIKRVIDTGNTQEIEYALPIPDRGEQYYEARLVPVDSDEIIAIVRNVTDRKKLEQHNIENTLEKERVGLLAQFIQTSAHEFRTPLSTISTSLYFIDRMSQSEPVHKRVEQVQAQVNLITQLVDTLLLIANLETSPTHTDDTIHTHLLLEDLCEDARSRHGNLPVLECEVADEIPFIRGNLLNLNRAFKQLLDNAFRFTPHDGEIVISAHGKGEQVFIVIQDSGYGIEADALPHIFKTFWREDSAHSTPGFGLGLPVAKLIIEQHGGEITVESEPGEWTRFTVSLPVCRE